MQLFLQICMSKLEDVMISNIKMFIKRITGIPQGATIGLESFVHYNRLRFGRLIYKRRYSASEIVDSMKKLGLKKGSVLMIHCSWDEFYNCDSSPKELIEAILSVIGPEGTLCMPAFPLRRKGKPFDIRRSRTTAGLLAEIFRTYPGVKRSAHIRHSVCAIGPMSDYLLLEHHLGETCWDEKSPFFRLSKMDSSLFAIGLGKYWEGTIMHCVESVLRKEIAYYNDMFDNSKTEFEYVDYDGNLKKYQNYEIKTNGIQTRRIGYLKNRRLVKKYLCGEYQMVSNLQIAKFDIPHVVNTLISLGRKGEDAYIFPSKKGYVFDN